MKKGFFRKTRKAICLLVIASFSTWLPGGAAWGAGNPVPLSAVKIPMPPNLGQFLKSDANGVPTTAARLAALQLGKALFWDMNVGGDGGQACASCHYRAGADPFDVRATNQLNPGANGVFDVLPLSPNKTLTSAMFPFTSVADPLNARLKDGLTLCSGTPCTGTDKDDVVGSQGVSFNIFLNTVFGNPLDNGTPQLDPTFGHSRRVTGRNTPPAVNAVFNYANFWDGRANNIFNGSSPIGPLDPGAGIWVNLVGPLETPILEFQKVVIPNASLASQAVGPPNNNVEMSWDGRSFPQLGHKMLDNGLTPLGQQLVSTADSLLGPLSNQRTTTGAKGLNTTYAQLIKDAFQDKYWSATGVNINGFFQMEANFSLFWGLAIMLYESTLVSDQSPFDLYLAGNTGAMTANQEKGFNVFNSKCAMCHAGSELSDATVSNALANGLFEQGVTNAGGAISDIGYANLGLRPTADDVGRGGIGGAPNPIASFAGQAIAQANGTLPFKAPQAIFNGIKADTPLAVNGSFKTPVLRNVALTAPYFHNGSVLSLADLVDFYARGGNFANAEQAKEMNAPTGIGADDRAALVDFLQNALTDPRVANDSAPFDHPELRIPDGTSPNLNDNNTDPKITLAATGGPAFDFDAFFAQHGLETATLADLPKATIASGPPAITNQTGAAITVAGTNVVAYQYQLNGGAYGVETPVGTAISLTNLAEGPHTVSVIGKSAGGYWQQLANATTFSWTVSTAPPALSVGPVATMTKNSTQTISGTVAAGVIPTVTVDTGAVVGPVTVSGNTWSCQVSGLNKGTNNITVTATSAAGNKSSKTATVKILIADGCYRGTGSPDISDALKSLKIAVGLVTPTDDDLLHGDVTTDGKIDTGDALLTLRKVAGLASF